MSENNKDRTVTIAIVTGIVTLLLGLCLGGVAGGLGGYFIGRGAAPRAAVATERPQVVPQGRVTPRVAQTPTPRSQMPQLPEMLSRSGALIQEVVKGTPAAEAGLKAGDVITKVDTTPIDATHKLGDILAGYKPGAQVTLTVWRVGNTQTIKVKLGENPDGSQRAYLGVRYSEITAGQPTPNPGQ